VNKISILRQYFGSEMMDAEAGRRTGPLVSSVFTGNSLQDVTVSAIRTSIASRKIKQKTRRHYREVFLHLFEFALTNHLIVATRIDTAPASFGTEIGFVDTFLKDELKVV
jgi:hypothetical protein